MATKAKKVNYSAPLLEQAKSLTLRPHQAILVNYRPLLKASGAMMLHLCGHRRMGKSTGEAAAIQETSIDVYNEKEIFTFPDSDVRSDFPKLAYLAETQAQARDIIWQNLCLRMSVFRDIEIKQRELRLYVPRPHLGDHIEIMFRSLRNHAQVRGNKLRHMFVDEAQFMSEDSYAKSVLSTLSDSKGTGITTGTAQPDGYYKDKLIEARRNGHPCFIIPASMTDVFSPQQLLKFRMEMGDRAFLQEYECDFNVPNKGTFFSEQLYKIEREPGFWRHSYDPELPLCVGVDIGIAEGMAFVIGQVQGERIVILDYMDNYEVMENVRNDFEDGGKEAWGIPYKPDYIFSPHDSKTRTIGVKRPHTVKDVLKQVFPEAKHIQVKRPQNKMAVITNTSEHLHLLGMCAQGSATGVYRCMQKLKNYGREVDKDGIVKDTIDKRHGHDHCADSLMTLFEGLKVSDGKIGMASRLHKREHSSQPSMTLSAINPRLSYYAAQKEMIDRRIPVEERMEDY